MDKFLKNINILKTVYLFYFISLIGFIIYLAYLFPDTLRALKRIHPEAPIQASYEIKESINPKGEW